MFLSLYTFIIIIIIMIVQVTDSVDVNEYQRLEPLRNKETLQRIRHYIKHTAENKRGYEYPDEAKLFDNIQEEGSDCSLPASEAPVAECVDNKDDTLVEIKNLLQKLLKKLDSMRSCKKRKTDKRPSHLVQKQDLKKEKSRENTLRLPRWGEWTSWSACSVSCGRGREIRWRHCVEQCDDAETEMEEKACQLPACSPGKFFGIRL